MEKQEVKRGGMMSFVERNQSIPYPASIDYLIDYVGIGNLIGASLQILPENILKRIVFMDLVRIHNTARAGSNIRRLTRDELTSRDRPFWVWEGLYIKDAKRNTLLRKMAAIKMLETSGDAFQDRIAYEAIDRLAPELRETAAAKVIERAKDPQSLRVIIAGTQRRYFILNLMARMKLYKMFTL
ncbi:MAG: hypothetical protein NTX14_03340 [Candidatus Nealsonbacteria bacterium]|nr:hypothetical protein [Candidatus Nealsonbacteria bacterium]